MQHFLFSGNKLHKMTSVVGLMVLLMPFGAVVHAQKPEEAKPAEQNKELESVKERLRQLEERFVNMQSRLGTIESMAGQRPSSSSAGMSAPQSPSLGSASPSGFGAGSPSVGGQSGMKTDESQGQGFTRSQEGGAGTQNNGMRSSTTDDSQIPAPVPAKKRRRIDDSGSFSPFDQSSAQPNKAQQTERVKTAAITPQPAGSGRLDVRQKTKVLHAPQGLDSSSPKTLYQASYRMLLKPDYNAAEKGFSYFLQEFPADKRASNAQYWLGEAYFVQKKYKNAATAYLRGYKKYPNSNKAPDSFLKLAVSLKKLGQKQASCATFKAFPTKYPNATSYVNRRYKIMLNQAGC